LPVRKNISLWYPSWKSVRIFVGELENWDELAVWR